MAVNYKALPLIVKAVTMGISRGGEKDFARCVDIARHALVKQGYLEAGSESGGVDVNTIRVTAQGIMRTAQNRMKYVIDGKQFDAQADKAIEKDEHIHTEIKGEKPNPVDVPQKKQKPPDKDVP